MNRNSFLRSSTFRLALLYVALFSASVLLLFAFIYWSTARYTAEQTDGAIIAEIRTLAERYETRGLPGLRRLISDRVERQRPTGKSIYLLSDTRQRTIVGNIDRWPQVDEVDGWLNFELETGGTRRGVHPARARQFQLVGGYRLLVGQDVNELKRVRLRIISSLGWGLLLTLALGLLGGMVMSRRMLHRLESINDTSQKIMDGDLGRRVPSRSSGDEFDQLADNLNRMLDQTESLMEGIRRVSDNIAHDLKTPLSRLRQRLEALSRHYSDDSIPKADLEAALQETDHLLDTFNALLKIARIESGPLRSDMQTVNLSTLAADVVELYEPLAEDKRQRLTFQSRSDPTVSGDRDMLFQAFANLIDNAIKYTPVGGIISVHCTSHDISTEFAVTDSGPGIPAEKREKVFQRFYRLDESRSTTGNGLGLSLVQAVASLHGATVSLTDAEPGLTVRFILPHPKDGALPKPVQSGPNASP